MLPKSIMHLTGLLMVLGLLVVPEPVLAGPVLTISPSSGPPGTRVTLRATGLEATTRYLIQLVRGTGNVNTVRVFEITSMTTATGELMGAITVQQAPGTYTVRVVTRGGTVVATAGLTITAPAADPKRCFPETGQCIEGPFRAYWERNGGLAAFGFPVTPARDEVNRDTGRTYLTQWFERNRFELHPENAAPYDVLLGRLGDDRLRQLGRNWQDLPGDTVRMPNCLWFQQTQFNVCDQAPGVGFMTYWRAHGLNDPTLDDYGRSLALFGLPLSRPRMETNEAGDAVLTQWFERARFEWHPDKPDQYKVLLGLLGNEASGTAARPPKYF